MLWLDHLIFGNGRGLATPYLDGRFYWLSGRLYTWIGGLGAQLQSFQWTHPKPGERRRLAGRDYYPFGSARHGLRVRVTWAAKLPDDLSEALATIRKIKSEIDSSVVSDRAGGV